MSYIGLRLRSVQTFTPAVACVYHCQKFFSHCMELPVKKKNKSVFFSIQQQKSTGQVEIDCFAYTYVLYSHCVIAVSETTVLGASAFPAAALTGPGLGCQCECDCECIC